MKCTVCHILSGNRMLLKLASRGVSKGKWNAVGGKIGRGETPVQNAIREAKEESGLMVSNLFYHGTLKFYLAGKSRLDALVHVYSTRTFSGKARSTKEGRLKWFGIDKIPYYKMWDDDRFWFGLMLGCRKFDGVFHFDKENKRVVGYEIRFR